MQERRNHERLFESLRVSYECERIDNTLGGGSVKNISCGGVCFPTMYDLLVGDTLDFYICLPEYRDPVKVKGEVVWKRENYFLNFRYLLGVQFRDLEESEQDKLFNHIQERLDRQQAPTVAWVG